MRLAAVTTLQFALVEGRDCLAKSNQRAVRCVRLTFQAQVVLLGLRPVVFPEAEIVGTVEQCRMVDVKPERAVNVALAQRKSHQRGTVCYNGFEHRLLARRIAQLDAG